MNNMNIASGSLSAPVEEFANDVYAQTFDNLKSHLSMGVNEYFHPFPQQGRGSWLHRRWWCWVVAPSLATLLNILLFKCSQVYIQIDFLEDFFAINADPFLLFRWANYLSMLIIALVGVWAGIGAGKRWRGLAFFLSFVILCLMILVSLPTDLVPLPESYIQHPIFLSVLVSMAWIFLWISHNLGRKMGQTLSAIMEIGYPLSKVFPAAMGRPVPRVTAQAYVFMKRDLVGDITAQHAKLEYIIAAAQAHLDFSEIMSLPWGIILTVISLGVFTIQLSLVPFFEGLLTFIKYLGVILLVEISILSVLFIAYHAALQVCILQAAAKCKVELICQQSSVQDSPVRTRRFSWSWLMKKLS